MEGKLSGEVVHATGVHEAQGVPDSSGAQNTLFCDWTDAPVGQGGGHDTCRFTVHLNGAELEGQKEGGQHSVKQRKPHRRLEVKMSDGVLSPGSKSLGRLSCLRCPESTAKDPRLRFRGSGHSSYKVSVLHMVWILLNYIHKQAALTFFSFR